MFILGEPAGRIQVATSLLYLAPLLSALPGASLGGTGPSAHSPQMGAFLATRPISSAGFVIAKLRMVTLSILLAYVLALAVLLPWLWNADFRGGLEEAWRRLQAQLGPAKAAAVVSLFLVGPLLLAWRQVLVNLFVGLAGRRWLTIANYFVIASVIYLILWALSQWEATRGRHDEVLQQAAWWLGLALLVKLALAVGAAIASRHARLMKGRAILTIAAVWLAAALALIGSFVWLIPEGSVPLTLLALCPALLIPLVRPMAAPLALAWNRHR
jgi:hypothetical protein